MKTTTELPRPRWYAAAVIGAIVAIAGFFTAAALVDNNWADGVFGFFTGVLAALLLAAVLWIEIGRLRLARMRDAAALDELEPLRAASDAGAAAPSARSHTTKQ